MSKYIEQFMKDNGLKVGEDFTVYDTVGKRLYPGMMFSFRVTDGRLRLMTAKDSDPNPWETNDVLGDLITGNLFVEKIPYKPTHGDKYWYIGYFKEPHQNTFNGATLDLILRRYNKCYRTREDALANKNRDLQDLYCDEENYRG